MTTKALQAHAEQIKQTVGSQTTCTSHTVSQLKSLLFPDPPTKIARKATSTTNSRIVRPTRGGRVGAKKQPDTTVVKVSEDARAPLANHDREKLATEIINITLKALSDAVKSLPLANTPCKAKTPQHATGAKSPPLPICSPRGSKSPLQPVCGNIVRAKKEQRRSSRQQELADGTEAASGLSAQAECARLALLALRIHHARIESEAAPPPLKIENAMITLISKLIALGLLEPAVRELRVLKNSLLAVLGATEKSEGIHHGPAAHKLKTADLLVFPQMDIKGPLLAMVVTFQLQVVRLIAASRNTSLSEAAMEHLHMKVPYSPVNLIQAQLDKTEPSAPIRIANQLETLSRMTASMCPSTSSSEDDCEKSTSVDPLTAFRLQLLTLEIRSIWWRIAGHEGDAVKDLFNPFSRFLATFRRRCTTGLDDGYCIVKDTIPCLASFKRTIESSPATCPAWCEAWRSIYFELFESARACSFNKEAFGWLEEYIKIPIDNSISPCLKCEEVCKVATMYAQVNRSPPGEQDIVRAFHNAEHHMKGDLQGSSKELDSLLLVITRLRKASGFIINRSLAPKENNPIPPSFELVRQCYSICTTSVVFLNRYVGKKPTQGAVHQAVQRYQQRVQQASAVSRNFLDSAVLIAKLSKGDDSCQWSPIEAGLQACLSLAAAIHDPDVKDLAENSGKSSIFVSVSNVYWLRYVHLKQMDEGEEARKALEGSINAVEHRPLCERSAAQIQIRLEHYAAAMENARDYRKAAEGYRKAIRLHVELGGLCEAAKVAATQSLTTLFGRDGEFATLGRVLVAFPRVATRMRSDRQLSTTYYDDEQLETATRALALEQQLVSLISGLETGSFEGEVHSTIQVIATKLLDLYSRGRFPIRRLRLVEALLWLRSSRPETLSPELLQQLAEDQNNEAPDGPQSSDSGLHFLAPHLLASKDAALAISAECPRLKQQKLESVLAGWHDQVNHCPDLKALQVAVGNPSVWLLHLELLAQHLDAQGLSWLRLSTLDLLVVVRERMLPLHGVALVLNLTQCGLQYLRLGCIHKAGIVFHKTRQYIDEAEYNKEAGVLFYVGYAEYYLATGSTAKCEEELALAREIFEKREDKCHAVSIHDRSRLLQLVSCVASVCSDLAARNGHRSEALQLARQSLSHSYLVWTSMTRRQKASRAERPVEGCKEEMDGLIDSMAMATVSDQRRIPGSSITQGKAPLFWSLIPHLHRSLLRVAGLYSDEGMSNEARYYLDQSRKFAEAASASGLLGQSLVQLADVMTRSEDYVGADTNLALAGKLYSSLEKDQQGIKVYVKLSRYHLANGQISAAEQACTLAESMLKRFEAADSPKDSVSNGLDVNSLQEQLSRFTMKEDAACLPASKRRLPVNPHGTQASLARKCRKAGNVSPCHVTASPLAFQDVLHQQIMLALRQGKLERVSDLLTLTGNRYCTPQEIVLHAMFGAEASIKRGFDAINADPVFCVLPESTVSLPSILPVSSSVPSNPSKPKPTKAGKDLGKSGRAPVRGTQVRLLPQGTSARLSNHFREAQISTGKVFELAQNVCSTASLHELGKLMAETSTMLSALDLSSLSETYRPSTNTFLSIIDAPRSTSMMRNRAALRVEGTMSGKQSGPNWPIDDDGLIKERPKWDQTLDAASFQEQYLNIIPQSWQVLSISLSRSRGEIIVSRIRSGQSPFILSMPLDRHSSRDPDEENFGYSQAKTELEGIIALADQSTHKTQDTSCKGARSAWWEGRAALDARLRDLLVNMEHMWFGGFHGVCSSRLPHRDLLSRFQISLSAILDNHLPSRQGQGKKQQTNHTKLDSRVIELFVALGDPVDLAEMEEPLMDLLYFVIDILQFHGERNAYDEVDFDSMTIATFDALRQYHEAAKKLGEPSATQHTILILDKELHSFPWESLPCLDGQAVTRLPSLGCLRDRILDQRQQVHEVDGGIDEGRRHYVNRRNGAYVLNPAGDLKATQGQFEERLGELSDWEGLTGREPSEEQMKSYLQKKDIFLYFGHGSGNQYVRPRTIQRLDQCAVALLMGCSSGKLTEAGAFEAYGTPMSYMQAGCPAMLATLWDVTDKDIDRLSETVLQKWGLFQSQAAEASSPIKKSARSRGKSKVRQSPPPPSERGNLSLDQAVAQGRGSCIFRYLNAAAPVVYGIPVFLA